MPFVSLYLYVSDDDDADYANANALTHHQVISLEGWTDIMYYVQDAHSFWDWIYFVLLIVVS